MTRREEIELAWFYKKVQSNHRYDEKTFKEAVEWADKTMIDNPANGYKEGYSLDKDILVKGNKIYSPETCCFVPQDVNVLFTKRTKSRGKYPIGVNLGTNGKYCASIRLNGDRKHLGYFNSPEEAFYAYKEAKEAHLKSVAEALFIEKKITKKVYDALISYKVEISD